jgi:hypothetical protein
MKDATPERIVAFLTGGQAMTNEERQRFTRRLRERDAEIERLRELSTELCNALDDCITWLSSGFAPQSQRKALERVAKAQAKYQAMIVSPAGLYPP